MRYIDIMIEVIPYDPHWIELFEQEQYIISEALGQHCEEIYHIGSTSVPGLAAKPKIDIIVIAKDYTRAIADLEKAGYSHKGEWNIPMKCGFTKKTAYCVNLHVFFDSNHPEIELNLKFRDYLRTNSDARDEYAQIKMQILQDVTSQQRVGKLSFPVYTLRKGQFIHKILKKIGFNRLRVLKCTTDDEWFAAKKFRQRYFFNHQKTKDPDRWTFNHNDHEHFVLYRGIEIVGYAHVQTVPKSEVQLICTNKSDFDAYLSNFIKQWMKIHSVTT